MTLENPARLAADPRLSIDWQIFTLNPNFFSLSLKKRKSSPPPPSHHNLSTPLSSTPSSKKIIHRMADEVYEGAIGIDLGMLNPLPVLASFAGYIRNSFRAQMLNFTARHNLLLRRQLRGHQCRDQYVPRIRYSQKYRLTSLYSCQRAG